MDIKEPRSSLVDYLVYLGAPGFAFLIGLGVFWLVYSVLGIRSEAWIVLLVGLPTMAGTAGVIYLFYHIYERKPSRKKP